MNWLNRDEPPSLTEHKTNSLSPCNKCTYYQWNCSLTYKVIQHSGKGKYYILTCANFEEPKENQMATTKKTTTGKRNNTTKTTKKTTKKSTKKKVTKRTTAKKTKTTSKKK